MRSRDLAFFLLFLSATFFGHAQDTLLLTNGKYKNLKGTVVFYDYSDVLFQTETQQEKMEAKLEKLQLKEDAKRSTDEWKAKQKAATEKDAKRREQERQLLAERRENFEKELKERKSGDYDAVSFERWKSRQETEIKSLEQKLAVDSALQAQVEDEKFERKKGRIRKRFTKQVSRQLVFSILRADGNEEVIYNADTLGLLADGDFEVEYGVQEMRLYIKGRQDGRKHSFHDVYIGAATGLVSGLLFTYFLDLFYAPIPPAIGVIILATRNNFKPSPKLQVDPSLLESEAYMDGYIQSAKGRKIFAFTVGAVGGLGVGIGVAIATSPMLQ